MDHCVSETNFCRCRPRHSDMRWRSGSKYVLMGMLVVNLVDSGTGAMVWRGMASGDVDANASPKKHDKKIHEVVQKIFRSYPPKE